MSQRPSEDSRAGAGKAAANHPGMPYPVPEQDLKSQQERLRKAAAAGTGPSKPLAPVATAWPDTSARQTETRKPAPPAGEPAKTSPAGSPAAAKQASARTVNISIALAKKDAKQVSLCGDFNQWSPEATPMKRKEGGRWEAALTLRPGRYQYKFIVDGVWMHDPNARENVPNPHGSLNSVMEVPGQ